MFFILLLGMFLTAQANTPSTLVNNTFKQLHTQLFSEHEVEDILNQLTYTANKYQFDDLNILDQLRQVINQQATFYKSAMTKKYDNIELIKGTAWGIASLGCAALIYYIYQKWHKPNNDAINQTFEDLLNRNVNIHTKMHTSGGHTISMVYLSPVDVANISPNELPYVQKSMDKLVRNYQTKDNALLTEANLGAFSFLFSILSFSHLYDGFHPIHQRNYAYYSLILEKIDQEVLRAQKRNYQIDNMLTSLFDAGFETHN